MNDTLSVSESISGWDINAFFYKITWSNSQYTMAQAQATHSFSTKKDT
jgi:hypothetical protein